jgi:hypothetical protein
MNYCPQCWGSGVIYKVHDTQYMFKRHDQKLIVFAFYGHFHELLPIVLGFRTDLQGPWHSVHVWEALQKTRRFCVSGPFLWVMRVNSTNFLHEGLRNRGRGRRMNSKVKISQTRRDCACIENKHGTQLAQSQSVPGRPLLAPIYRWPGLKEPVGFNTNYSVHIQYHLVFLLLLCSGLT